MPSIHSDTAYPPFMGLEVVSKGSNPLAPFMLMKDDSANCSSIAFHRQGEIVPRARRRERVMLPREDPSGLAEEEEEEEDRVWRELDVLPT